MARTVLVRGDEPKPTFITVVKGQRKHGGYVRLVVRRYSHGIMWATAGSKHDKGMWTNWHAEEFVDVLEASLKKNWSGRGDKAGYNRVQKKLVEVLGWD